MPGRYAVWSPEIEPVGKTGTDLIVFPDSEQMLVSILIGKGRWIARYNRTGMPPKEFSGKTKAEVKAKLDEYKFLVQSGEAVSLKLTVEQYSTKFLHYKSQQVTHKNLKQTAYDRTESIFESHIKPHPISQILMCNLKASDIQGLLDEMQPNYSYSTIRKVYLFLHSMIKYGKTEKDLPKTYDPFLTVEMPDDLIVCTNTGNFPTSRNIQETLDRILRRCGLPHYGTHALRHTFATRLLSKTSSHQDIKAVAELLGDDYKVVIKIYLHTDTGVKHDLVDQL